MAGEVSPSLQTCSGPTPLRNSSATPSAGGSAPRNAPHPDASTEKSIFLGIFAFFLVRIKQIS
jgi:hypothetical protein